MPRIGGSALKAALPDLLTPVTGPTTCTIYRLIPTTLLPIEPLIDIVPTLTPFRQQLDVVSSQVKNRSYRVTRVPIQDGKTSTINVHHNLDTLVVTGTISGAPSLQIAGALGLMQTLLAQTGGPASRSVALGATVPGFPAPRRDLIQLQLLELLADAKEMVMVVTPEGAMPRAFIENISKRNGPDIGVATEVTISFVEARVISPVFADAVPDADELLGGTTETQDVGGQPTTDIETPPDLGGGGMG